MSRKLRIRQLLKLFNLAKLKAKLFMADKENEH